MFRFPFAMAVTCITRAPSRRCSIRSIAGRKDRLDACAGRDHSGRERAGEGRGVHGGRRRFRFRMTATCWLTRPTTQGFRQYTLQVKDLRTGEFLAGARGAGGLDRMGGRQSDALLHGRGRRAEAAVPALPAWAGRAARGRLWSMRRPTSGSISASGRTRDGKYLMLESCEPHDKRRVVSARPTIRGALDAD